jgi:plastocyanin
MRLVRLHSLALAVMLGLAMVASLPGASDHGVRILAGQTALARAIVPDEEGFPLMPSSTPPKSDPTSEATSVDRDASAPCDPSTAVRTSTITLDAAGASPSCILVGAGDLITWVNRTASSIDVRASNDQFFDEGVSAGFSTLRVPAGGQVRVRLIHAGRVDFAAPSQPGVRGTILVLGRGAA